VVFSASRFLRVGIDGHKSSGRRIRIAYVITDLHTGGVPLHLLRLSSSIRDHGFEPHVISLSPPGAVTDGLNALGIATYSCDARSAVDVAALCRLAMHFRTIRPRVVHSLLFHANVASRLVVRLGGVSRERLICEIQTAEIERRWHLSVGGATHRLGRVVVGNSPSVVDHLCRRAHMSRSRLLCIPGGVDMDRLHGAMPVDRSVLGLADEDHVLIWVGRMDPIKGLETLIPAFAKVSLGEGRCKLVLVGDGPTRKRVDTLVRRHALGDKVLTLGRRDDVYGLLRMADAFVFPSLTEGFPNSLLEAMAVGLPVVTTDVPGCRDLVTDGENGLLVRPNDVGALHRAVEAVIGDGVLSARLGENAANHVRCHYTLDRCVDRYASLYRDVLS
jgi:glycosyltransferase involved in cell wall biosynthesis